MNQTTMRDLSNIWLKYKERAIKKTSYMQYKRIINKYIDVYLGDYLVDEITIQNIVEFIETISEDLSNKTLQDIIVVLKSILSYGEIMGYCHIPLKAIPNIKVIKKKINIFLNDDLFILEQYLLNNMSYKNIGILICLYTGIRLGEICALKWEDIVLEEEKIIINKSVFRISEKGRSYTEIGTPKSSYSNREIPISHILSSYLKKIHIKEGYVITGTDNYLDPRSYQYYFKRVLKRLNINDYNFHVLRHTFATRCVQCSIDIKSLSEILGHSSAKITLDVYVHSSFSIKIKQMKKFSLI